MFFPFVCRRVIGGSPTVYKNGYSNHLRGIASTASLNLTATLSNIVLRVTRQADDLRSVANGGYVESAEGWDILYEHPSLGRLYHDLDLYDPSTGLVSSWVRFPSIANNDVLIVDLYFGKAGLSASEEDPHNTWKDAYFVLDLSTGLDLTPTGQNLLLEGVIATRMRGMSAGDYGEFVVSEDSIISSNGDFWITSGGDTWAINP